MWGSSRIDKSRSFNFYQISIIWAKMCFFHKDVGCLFFYGICSLVIMFKKYLGRGMWHGGNILYTLLAIRIKLLVNLWRHYLGGVSPFCWGIIAASAIQGFYDFYVSALYHHSGVLWFLYCFRMMIPLYLPL